MVLTYRSVLCAVFEGGASLMQWARTAMARLAGKGDTPVVGLGLSVSCAHAS